MLVRKIAALLHKERQNGARCIIWEFFIHRQLATREAGRFHPGQRRKRLDLGERSGRGFAPIDDQDRFVGAAGQIEKFRTG
jgi:hypothetical protein